MGRSQSKHHMDMVLLISSDRDYIGINSPAFFANQFDTPSHDRRYQTRLSIFRDEDQMDFEISFSRHSEFPFY